MFDEGLITAVSVGCVLVLFGAVALLTPNVVDQSQAFIKDLGNASYTLGKNSVNLVAPLHPQDHTAIYTAATYFFVGIAVLELFILPVRLYVKSPIRRVAGTVGSIVFWLGGAVAAQVFLLSGTTQGWFNFWAIMIVLVGLSLIARAIVRMAKPRPRIPTL
jgi:hypothetical protein